MAVTPKTTSARCRGLRLGVNSPRRSAAFRKAPRALRSRVMQFGCLDISKGLPELCQTHVINYYELKKPQLLDCCYIGLNPERPSF